MQRHKPIGIIPVTVGLVMSIYQNNRGLRVLRQQLICKRHTHSACADRQIICFKLFDDPARYHVKAD